MIRSSLQHTIRVALLFGLALGACRDGRERGQRESEQPPRGSELVVGSAAADWALLTLPRDGGVPDLRSLNNPDEVIWSGKKTVPAASQAHALDDGLIVLQAEDGKVFTYDAAAELLEQIGSVGSDARWTSSGATGVFFAPGGGEILEIARGGSWRYEVSGPVTWVSPAEGGVLALITADDGPASLWLLRHGQEGPAAEREVSVSAPGLVTAWGRRAALTDRERPEVLRLFSVEPIESVGRVDMAGRVLALAASPSSHAIYVSMDGPPAVAAVDRFTLTQQALARLDRPAQSLRSSLFGECLLVRAGEQVAWMPITGGEALTLRTEWREDLPLGLPGCRVLGVRDGRTHVIEVEPGGREIPLEGSADRWWLPVRSRAAATRVVADRLEGRPLRDSLEGEVVLPRPEAAERPTREAEEETAVFDGTAPADRAIESRGVPPGFYAIVGSARQEAGIARLVASLAGAGYPTEVQPSPDDAGTVWYRGLVGPFDSRTAAEAAARQLLRERRLEAWVTEISESAPTGTPGG